MTIGDYRNVRFIEVGEKIREIVLDLAVVLIRTRPW